MLANTKLNSIEVLISEALTHSSISHDKFVSVNDALKGYNDIKKEIRNLNRRLKQQFKDLNIITKKFYLIVWSLERK